MSSYAEPFTICITASQHNTDQSDVGGVLYNIDCFLSSAWIYFLCIFIIAQILFFLKFYVSHRRKDKLSLKNSLGTLITSAVDRSILKYFKQKLNHKLFCYFLFNGGLFLAKPLAILFYTRVRNEEYHDQLDTDSIGYIVLAFWEIIFSSWQMLIRILIVLLLGCKNEILYVKNSQPNEPLDFTIEEYERSIYVKLLVEKTIGYWFMFSISLLPELWFIRYYEVDRNLARTIFQFTINGVLMTVAFTRMKFLFTFEKEMLKLNSSKLQQMSVSTLLKQHLKEIKPSSHLFNALAGDNSRSFKGDEDEKDRKQRFEETITQKLTVVFKNNLLQLSKKIDLVRCQNSISIPRNPRDNYTLTKVLVIYIIIETLLLMIYSIAEFVRAGALLGSYFPSLLQEITAALMCITDLISICVLPWFGKFLIENRYIFGDDPLRSILNESTLEALEGHGKSPKAVIGGISEDYSIEVPEGDHPDKS